MLKKLLFIGSCGLVLGACAVESNVATYDGGSVTSAEFQARLESEYGKSMLSSMILEDVFKGELSADELAEITKQAKADLDTQIGSNGADSFNDYLEYYGISEETYLNNMVMSLVMEKVVTERVEISKDEYEELYEEYKPELTASHILVADEATANEVITKLNEGGDFATLASEYSIDSSASSGGSLGTFASGTMVTEFEDAAYAMEVGTYSGTPVATEYGYHVIKLEAKAEKGTLKEMKESLKATVVADILNGDGKELTAIIKELLEEKNVKILDEDLKDALSAYLPSVETTKNETETEATKDSSNIKPVDGTQSSSATSEGTSETTVEPVDPSVEPVEGSSVEATTEEAEVVSE